MCLDHNDVQTKSLPNGELSDCSEFKQSASAGNAQLLVYALDFTGKVVKLNPEPILRKEFPADQSPEECVLIPISERSKFPTESNDSTATSKELPRGQVALVCRDGVVRLLDLSNLKIVTEAKLKNRKFISAAYCTSK